MSEKKKQKKLNVQTIFNQFDRDDLHIQNPSERMEDMLQKAFQPFRLEKVQVNFTDFENFLRERNANNVVTVEFSTKYTQPETPHLLKIEYSRSGDGGYHESTCCACVGIYKDKKPLQQFNLEFRSDMIPQNSRSNNDNNISFLTEEMNKELLKHMPMLVGRFTVVVEKVFNELIDSEMKILEKEDPDNEKDFACGNKYLGNNPHGVQMQALQEINNFLYAFIKKYRDK